MSDLLPPSRAEAIVRSEFRLLRPFYLGELQWIDRAVPAGALTMAAALQSVQHQTRLHAVAADPVFDRWLLHFGKRLGGPGHASRDLLVQLAGDAQAAQRFRRAAQLYAWLLLTSQEPDMAMHTSLRNLLALAHGHYRQHA